MGSAPPDLSAMKSNPKFIFFTDFDGTITLQDSNDYMTDNIGYGQEKRRQSNKDTFENKITFRDSFQEMMDSISTPYPQCIDLLVKNISLDPYFVPFLEFARSHNIPTVVLSSGMEPIIKALLKSLVGDELSKDIQVIANTVRARPGKTLEDEGGWEIVFHDESGFGHDKSRAIRPYANLPADKRPTLFYAGDGVSDLSAARETDLLFAKKGRDLVGWCVKEDVPFTVFEDWKTIVDAVESIVDGKTTVQAAAAEGHRLHMASLSKGVGNVLKTHVAGNTTPLVQD